MTNGTDLDFRLLAALSRNPFQSLAGLARAAGASATTARRRLAALTAGGVLRGVAAIPAAEVFGREGWVCNYPEGPKRAVDLRSILAVEDVIWADRHHDGGMGVMSYVRPGADLPPADLVDRMGEPHEWYRYPAPARRDRLVLSPLDWRVIAAAIEEPRAGTNRLAERSRLSPKTLRKRKADLVRDGILDVFPLLAPGNGSSAIYHHLAVYVDSPSRFHAVIDAAGSAIVVHTLTEPAGMYLFCRSESLIEQQATQRRIAEIPGVQAVRFVLNLEFEFASDRLGRLVEAERAKWDERRRGVREPPRPPP